MRQADIFMQSEGGAWLERNRDKHTTPDPVAEMIETMKIKPNRVLEVGCADGWRLAALRDKYRCEVLGVEPSLRAGVEAAERRVPVVQSSATVMPLSGKFDLVIYGFCLYVTDPAEWLRIAAEGDAVLQPGGHLIIHDFADVAPPFARKYEHCEGVFAYHFYFPELWLSHPLYQLVHSTVVGGEMVTLLRKHPVSEIEVRP